MWTCPRCTHANHSSAFWLYVLDFEKPIHGLKKSTMKHTSILLQYSSEPEYLFICTFYFLKFLLQSGHIWWSCSWFNSWEDRLCSRRCREELFVGEAGFTMRERNGIFCVEERKNEWRSGWRQSFLRREGGSSRDVPQLWGEDVSRRHRTGQPFIILVFERLSCVNDDALREAGRAFPPCRATRVQELLVSFLSLPLPSACEGYKYTPSWSVLSACGHRCDLPAFIPTCNCVCMRGSHVKEPASTKS